MTAPAGGSVYPAPVGEATVEKLVAGMFLAYPRQPVSAANVTAYARGLSGVPLEVLSAAIDRCVQTEEWLPTVALIRRTAAEMTAGLPTEAEALGQIQARQAWAREGGGDGVPPIHPLVHDALVRVGGWHAFRTAENAEVIRGQFGRIYRDLRAEAIRVAQTG